MGIGIGSGKSRAKEGATGAISSPLLESSIEGAKGVVFNITGGRDLTLHEVNVAAEAIYEVVDPNANIIFGAVIDEKMQGEIRITVIATGFSGDPLPEKKAEKTVKTPIVSNEPSVFPVEEEEEESPNPPTLDIPAFLQKRRFPKP